MAADTKPGPVGPMTVTSSMKTVMMVLMALGVAGVGFGIFAHPTRAWHAYLVAMFYFLSLGLGGIFFVAIQHLTKAGWSVTVRRFSEAFSAYLPFAAVMALVFGVLGSKHLYQWFNTAFVAQDEILQHKAAYLNPTFFFVRLFVFFGIWLFFSHRLVHLSTDQDKSGDPNLTLATVKPSIGFLLLFALSYSLFSVDVLMSLDPHWFSTIFGVYCFAGLFQSTMAAMILLTLFFMKNGKVNGYVTMDHVHDLGKFLKAFTVFWAYIAFSQYMLMWYANLPEETTFFITRSEGSWALVSVLLIVFKFIVPFIALLPRWAKRTPVHLATICVLILVMQYVDVYWLVYPNLNEKELVFGLTEILAFCGFLGLFLFALTRFLSRNNIVAIRDPRIDEALHHHVVY